MTRTPWEEPESHDELEHIAPLDFTMEALDDVAGKINELVDAVNEIRRDHKAQIEAMEKELLEAKGERELLSDEE